MIILDLILIIFLLSYNLLLVGMAFAFLTASVSGPASELILSAITMFSCWIILSAITFFDFLKRDWGKEETDRESWKQAFSSGTWNRGYTIIIAEVVYCLTVIRKIPLNNLTAWCLKNRWTKYFMNFNSMIAGKLSPAFLIIFGAAFLSFFVKSRFLNLLFFSGMGALFFIPMFGGRIVFDVMVLNDMLSYDTEEDLFGEYEYKMDRYYEDYMRNRFEQA